MTLVLRLSALLSSFVLFALTTGCAGGADARPAGELVFAPAFGYEQPDWQTVRVELVDALEDRLMRSDLEEFTLVVEAETLRVKHRLSGIRLGQLKALITDPGGADLHLVVEGPQPGQTKRVIDPKGGTVYVSLREDETVAWERFAEVRAARDATGQPSIAMELDEEGARQMGELSGSKIGRSLAVVTGGRAISIGVLRDRVTDSLLVSGDFSVDEVDHLVRLMQLPPLPCRLELIEETRYR